MKLRMAFIFLCLFSIKVYAVEEVTCYKDDCLKYGWEVFDRHSGKVLYLYCTDQDCLTQGWTVENTYGQLEAESICKTDGCFSEGWDLYSGFSGHFISESVCHKLAKDDRDCLINGWSTYQVNRAPIRTACLRGDCMTYGWDSKMPGYMPQRVRCKPGGCFKEGWIAR